MFHEQRSYCSSYHLFWLASREKWTMEGKFLISVTSFLWAKLYRILRIFIPNICQNKKEKREDIVDKPFNKKIWSRISCNAYSFICNLKEDVKKLHLKM